MLAQESSNVLNIGIEYIQDYYNKFLADFVEGTAKNYKTDLNLFFKQVYGKSPEFVTIQDIESTKMLDVVSYNQYLSEEIEKTVKGELVTEPRYKNNSINRKINAVKSFFKFLSKDYKTIDEDIFKGIKRKKPSLDTKGWDGLDWMEAIDIWEFASVNFGKDSNQLSMLFKLASITSVRLDALLSSEWEKHWYTKNERGVIVNYIEIQDKGEMHKKPISEAFYNELQDKLGTSGKLFPNMHPNKVGDAIKKTTTELGFDPRRRIVFHSFKKTGVMRALEKTGNMYKAKQQGNHKSITTTEAHYLKYKECLMDMTSFTMDEDIDVKVELDKYSKEELVKAIAQLSDGAIYELLRNLDK